MIACYHSAGSDDKRGRHDNITANDGMGIVPRFRCGRRLGINVGIVGTHRLTGASGAEIVSVVDKAGRHA